MLINQDIKSLQKHLESFLEKEKITSPVVLSINLDKLKIIINNKVYQSYNNKINIQDYKLLLNNFIEFLKPDKIRLESQSLLTGQDLLNKINIYNIKKYYKLNLVDFNLIKNKNNLKHKNLVKVKNHTRAKNKIKLDLNCY